ncbi:hypothetical protein R3P38DRAFT_2583846, partial [Favolaschia claudopus]
HPLPYIRCILVLVAYLHTKHHLSFRACALLLQALNFVFRTIPGKLLGNQEMPRTLVTVFSQLGLSDKFKIYPICYLCNRIFTESDGFSLCPTCKVDLYRSQSRRLFNRLFAVDVLGDNDDDSDSDGGDDFGYRSNRTAHLVQPIQLLSDALRDLLTRPGMVDAVNAWKRRPIVAGELKSIHDANVWKTIQGPDGTSFFFGRGARDEIRLGLSLSLDWFGKKTSSYGPSHSSGALSFCVQNFENEIR